MADWIEHTKFIEIADDCSQQQVAAADLWFSDTEIKQYQRLQAEVAARNQPGSWQPGQKLQIVASDVVARHRLQGKMARLERVVFCDQRRRLESRPRVQKPIFLVTYGPPGSGKGACLNAFLRKVRPPSGVDEADYFELNIDNIVAALDGGGGGGTIAIDAQNYDFFRPMANRIVDDLREIGIKRGVHLILETTGDSVSADWYRREVVDEAHKRNYFVVVVYPLSSVAELLRRVEVRVTSGATRRRPADEFVRTAATRAADNIATLIQIVDKTIVFDNSPDGEACHVEIIECDRTACTVNWAWLSKQIAEKFGGLTLNLGSSGGTNPFLSH
jgi:predicted ABC-type ATPase